MDQTSTECTRKKSCIQPPTTMPIWVRVALWGGILWKQLFFLFGCKSPKPLKRHMVLTLWLICVHAFTEGFIRVFIVISIHSCYGKVLLDSVCFSIIKFLWVGKKVFFKKCYSYEGATCSVLMLMGRVVSTALFPHRPCQMSSAMPFLNA